MPRAAEPHAEPHTEPRPAPAQPRARVTPAPEPPRRAPRAASPAGPAPRSRQRDPFQRYYAEGQAIAPPYSYDALVKLYDSSDVLLAALDAMQTNISGLGMQLVPLDGEITETSAEAAQTEKRRLSRWFDYASSQGSFTRLRRRTRLDLELFGDAYWEMLRDSTGRLVGIEHVRAYTMRKAPAGEDQEVERWVRGEDGAWQRVKHWQRFRLLLQFVDGAYTWFKEWGDPRPVRWDTGKVDPSAPPELLASELLNFSLYSPDHVYGRPRWRGAACDVAGRTAAAEINVDTFDHKGVPPALILVQGALLGAGAVEKIQQHFESLKGRANWHAPLVIEAAGETTPTGDGPVPSVRITVEDLTKAVQTDALFSKYRAEAADNVAMAFRLPRLYLGRVGDFNRATAEAAKLVAEEQVFAPERLDEDEILNREVLPELGARFWKVESRVPPLLSEDSLATLLRVGLEAGALTPAQVAEVLEPLLGQELSRPEAWARIPTRLLDALVKAGWRPELEGVEPGAGAQGKSPEDPEASITEPAVSPPTEGAPEDSAEPATSAPAT